MSAPAEVRQVTSAGAIAAALLVAQQVAGKATRDALFLTQYSAAALPALMITSSVVAMISAMGMSRLLATRAPRQVLPALVGAHAALLLAQTLLAFEVPRIAAVLVYFQMAATGGTLLSAYWSVVNERFDPWMAKQVVRHLGLGASIGGVAGGLLAWMGARAVPVPAMLLVMAALNVAALVAIVRFGGDARPGAPEMAADVPPLRILRSTPYLRHLALAVAFGAGTEALVDYVLKARAAEALAGGPDLMAFFALYHTGIGVLALAFQWLVVRPGLEAFGLAGAVAFRPLAVVAASIAGLVDPRLWSAALCRGSHDVFSSSLFRAGYELMYTPLPERQKRATKQLIDVGFDKLGAFVGGGAAWVAVRFVESPDRALLVLAGAASLSALALTGRLHRGYIAALEQGLRAGKIRLTPSDVVDSTTRLTLAEVRSTAPHAAGPAGSVVSATTSDPLLQRIADLRSSDAVRIRGALKDAEDLDPALVPHLAVLLARNDFYLEALRALRLLVPRATGQIVDLLVEPGVPAAIRRRLPRVLKVALSQRAVDGLVLGLADVHAGVRSHCIQALTALVARAPALHVPNEAVFAAARRELESAQPDLEYVFALLSLVLEREPLRTAAWALRGPDAGMRGTALEYLANVVPPDLRALLWPHLGAAPRAAARPLDEVIGELRSGRSRRLRT